MELVMVMILLAILAVVAIPRYQNQTVQKAETGVADGISAALRTARDLLYSEHVLQANPAAYTMMDVVARAQIEGAKASGSDADTFTVQINDQTYTWGLVGVALPADKGNITKVGWP